MHLALLLILGNSFREFLSSNFYEDNKLTCGGKTQDCFCCELLIVFFINQPVLAVLPQGCFSSMRFNPFWRQPGPRFNSVQFCAHILASPINLSRTFQSGAAIARCRAWCFWCWRAPCSLEWHECLDLGWRDRIRCCGAACADGC